jgi:DNA-binding NarL/FixJ family response regulator
MFFTLKRKNSDLEIAQKNSEIQNYIMRIKELKELYTKDKNSKVDVSKKLKDLDLTKREQKVLELIADGYSNDRIAETMYISKNTVKSHIKNIYMKLDVKNRIQVIRKVRNG